MSSIFKKIINHEIPAHIVYEDDVVIAFLDISQANPGHTLICPKEVYANIYELPESVAEHLFKVTVKLARAIKKAFNPDGLNIINNNGEAASQSVFHFHVHLIPRYFNDEIKLVFPDNSKKVTDEELAKRATLIREAL